jgi:hypothetical protein
MKSYELQSCIRHWYKLQASGKCPFRFKHVLPGDYRPQQAHCATALYADEEIELPDIPSSPQSTANLPVYVHLLSFIMLLTWP